MQRLFNFYLKSSFHVSLAVVALQLISYYQFDMAIDQKVLLFGFSSSIVGNNYAKFSPFLKHKNLATDIKIIILVSVLMGGVAVFEFFQFNTNSKLALLLIALLTFIYQSPSSKGINLRNIPGLKAYIVAICWTIVTLILPLLETEIHFDTILLIRIAQRFLFVFSLILVFDIIDLKEDRKSLHTLPQTIGVKKTKRVVYAMLISLSLLELYFPIEPTIFGVYLLIKLVTFGFTYFADEKKSKYYTTFWVESIPILWAFLLYLYQYISIS